MGDENYHLVYGFMSTLAMTTVGYSYYKLKHLQSSQLAPLFTSRIPVGNVLIAWGLTSVGLVLASQAMPKMQIPVAVVSSRMEDAPRPSSSEGDGTGGYRLQVRCPFDFSDKHNKSLNDGGDQVRGLERVSRHTGLWSFGLISAGNAMLQSNVALRIWWLGPAAVAWIGGMHTDSRFRRGMGGTLDPMAESQTSNIPFWAMISGKQGSPTDSFGNLALETKPLNACIAVAVATTWILSRGRIP